MLAHLKIARYLDIGHEKTKKFCNAILNKLAYGGTPLMCIRKWDWKIWENSIFTARFRPVAPFRQRSKKLSWVALRETLIAQQSHKEEAIRNAWWVSARSHFATAVQLGTAALTLSHYCAVQCAYQSAKYSAPQMCCTVLQKLSAITFLRYCVRLLWGKM